MTESTPDPQQPPDPQPLQYPQYPSGPEAGQPAANPRPIRASRVWAGIGLAFLGHILAACVGGVIASAGSGASSYFGFAFPVLELGLLAACITLGTIQLRRGDRGIGVGLLIGWAASAVVFAGVCVVLIVLVASAVGG